jgi:murein DD-endopeptidase MepM/ murein hydrolase activator NlpD
VPKPSEPSNALARRALIEDIKKDKKSWLQHGVAALAVSLLGLGVAGSVVLTGSAQQNAASADPTAASSVSATDRGAASTSRSNSRTALDPAKVKSLADQRAEELSKANEDIDADAKEKAAEAREKALKSDSKATSKQAKLLISGQAARSSRSKSATSGSAATAIPASGGKSCMPITRGYSIAARFGQVGSWSRYHTGFDFSAPVGTPLHAPASGVVTNAGIGSASGWAGNYVAIKYSDGTQTLMAHMSTVSVRTGQTVSACQVVGAVGMTGRTFGPHVHFEVYPSGITPGDVYRAVNPVSWLNSHGLRP